MCIYWFSVILFPCPTNLYDLEDHIGVRRTSDPQQLSLAALHLSLLSRVTVASLPHSHHTATHVRLQREGCVISFRLMQHLYSTDHLPPSTLSSHLCPPPSLPIAHSTGVRLPEFKSL
ncbi:hypothetical protein E2C01_090557 [Portunus trituberculatus]|uniref:Uncharacterized protein n=1 Tax=Portunus trituberculatus TaxID=210409 RepID=A0A5B7JF07_PORTR|nr:hypothetical protein [Portunus trituberculatus]